MGEEHIVSAHTGRPLDVLELAGMRVHCIVGLYPAEIVSPQPLEVSLALHLDTSQAAVEDDLTRTVDYAQLAGELRFVLENGRFRLLETAAQAVARYVLLPPSADVPRPRVDAVDVRLRKPEAMKRAEDGVPSLHVRRYAADQVYPVEDRPFGQVDVVHERPGCGIYRLRIAPGRAIETHVHRRMEEAELVVGPGLLVQGRPVRAGTAFRWPRDFPHRYENRSAVEQSVICIDRPAFDPSDEVEVPAPAGGLEPLSGAAYYPREAHEPVRGGEGA